MGYESGWVSELSDELMTTLSPSQENTEAATGYLLTGSHEAVTGHYLKIS